MIGMILSFFAAPEKDDIQVILNKTNPERDEIHLAVHL